MWTLCDIWRYVSGNVLRLLLTSVKLFLSHPQLLGLSLQLFLFAKQLIAHCRRRIAKPRNRLMGRNSSCPSLSGERIEAFNVLPSTCSTWRWLLTCGFREWIRKGVAVKCHSVRRFADPDAVFTAREGWRPRSRGSSLVDHCRPAPRAPRLGRRATRPLTSQRARRGRAEPNEASSPSPRRHRRVVPRLWPHMAAA